MGTTAATPCAPAFCCRCDTKSDYNETGQNQEPPALYVRRFRAFERKKSTRPPAPLSRGCSSAKKNSVAVSSTCTPSPSPVRYPDPSLEMSPDLELEPASPSTPSFNVPPSSFTLQKKSSRESERAKETLVSFKGCNNSPAALEERKSPLQTYNRQSANIGREGIHLYPSPGGIETLKSLVNFTTSLPQSAEECNSLQPESTVSSGHQYNAGSAVRKGRMNDEEGVNVIMNRNLLPVKKRRQVLNGMRRSFVPGPIWAHPSSI